MVVVRGGGRDGRDVLEDPVAGGVVMVMLGLSAGSRSSAGNGGAKREHQPSNAR